MDTGVDKTHPFLAGKVVSEACYVFPDGCAGGVATGTGPGTGIPADSGQFHGTHVAGIAAGNAPNAVPPPAAPLTNTSSGMAQGAKIIAINVFGPYDGALDSDIIAGLNRVYDLRTSFNIASVNMSLGDGVANVTNCDADPMKPAIDQLRSVNIATVISSGNGSYTNAINGPGCISTAVSVGSTTKTDGVSSFSNVSSFMSLFAPGSSIDSSLLPSGAYGFLSGTSMAAPHVAGAWAVLKQTSPTATVSQILTTLQSTGLSITDTRGTPSVTKPRINIKNAVVLLQPGPVPTSIAPTTALLGATLNVTITGTGFASGATSSFGAGITVNNTTFVSSTQLTANITILANATPGARTVSVTNPSAGTGTLANAFTITAPAPSLTSISPTPVIVGGPAFTLTVTGTGFATTSVVRVNGVGRTTGFVSATRLTGTILAADIAT
ncbi:MAG: S8 family serine peptidase, partial [Candidatus Rokubacteria bacterium]|nr:S8 family serine peptidase [Candidatus Rokubacteria bacterium]